MKAFHFAALLALLGFTTSCTTTYDAYGSPRQSVDPGVALMAVAAAGIAGYAISNSRNNNRNRGYSSSRYSSYQSNPYGGARRNYGRGNSYGGGYSRGGYSNCY